uniref:Uncharacterized protein n=1 Tax=Anguilla anguilla TaxID=7936 RepID=A0A0E9SYA1_ANGAN
MRWLICVPLENKGRFLLIWFCLV